MSTPKKLETPKNLTINVPSTELTFEFGGTEHHGIAITGPKGPLVAYSVIKHGPLGGRLHTDALKTVTIDWILLLKYETSAEYVPGNYVISVKGVRENDTQTDSDPATIDFELNAEQAAQVNAKLIVKRLAEIEEEEQKAAVVLETKLTVFPAVTADGKEILSRGNATEKEIKDLHSKVKDALAQLRRFTSKASEKRKAAYQSFKDALDKVIEFKNRTEATPAEKDEITEKDSRHLKSWVTPVVALIIASIVAIIFICYMAGTVLIAYMLHSGPIEMARILAPNGINGGTIPITVTNVVQVAKTNWTSVPVAAPLITAPTVENKVPSLDENLPVAPRPDTSLHSGVRRECVPPYGMEGIGKWTDIVYPGEVVVYNYRVGYKINPDFDPGEMHGKRQIDPSHPGSVTSITMLLLRGVTKAQPVTFTITAAY